MAAAIALLERIIAVLANLLPIIETIRGVVEDGAKEHGDYHIESRVDLIYDRVYDPVYGLDQLHVDVAAMQSDITAISTAITALGSPVQTTAPPSWYTAPTTPPTVSDIAAEVWYNTTMTVKTNQDGSSSHTMQELVWEGHDHLTRLAGFRGIPAPNNPYFSLVGNEIADVNGYHLNWTHDKPTIQPGLPDWTALLSADTPLAFLQRTQPLLTWTLSGPATTWTNGETVWLNAFNGVSIWWWRFNVSQAELDLLKMVHGIAPSWWVEPPDAVDVGAFVPPVWPGDDNVTLGTSYPLSDGLELTGPMHGVLIVISGHPSGAGVYGFGSVNSWSRVGAVIFGTDAGDYERSETFAIDTQVVCPKMMTVADSAIIRLNSGFTGTVRPWSRNT